MSGYDVVNLDWLHNPAEAMEIAKGRITIQGNVDPGILYGGRAAITEAVHSMVYGFGGGNQGRIANLGHREFKPSFFLLQHQRLTLYTVRGHSFYQTRGSCMFL